MARRLVGVVVLVAALLPMAGADGADAQTPKRGGTFVMDGGSMAPLCFLPVLERCDGSYTHRVPLSACEESP